MADPVHSLHSDPNRPFAGVVAYLSGDLPPGERAEFEAHLPGCERCREALALERRRLPELEPMLPVFRTSPSSEEPVAKAPPPEAPTPQAARSAWPQRLCVLGALAAMVTFYLVRRKPTVEAEAPVLAGPQQGVPSSGQIVLFAPTQAGGAPQARAPGKPVRMPAGTAGTLEIQRPPKAEFVAVALVLPGSHLLLLTTGERPLSSCSPHCPVITLSLPADVPAGQSEIVAVEGERPVDTEALREWLPTAPHDTIGEPPAAVGGDLFGSETLTRE